MPTSISEANSTIGALILSQLVTMGIRHVLISPGSRSTPLTLAAAKHALIQTHVLIDERAAAFFALGLAKALLSPVAIITTSGTAVANLLPAVVEAYYDEVPLILLTADRPEELQHCGSNQTINQKGIFSNFVSEQIILPAADDKNAAIDIEDALSKYRDKRNPITRPIHINCPFREPLYDPGS